MELLQWVAIVVFMANAFFAGRHYMDTDLHNNYHERLFFTVLMLFLGVPLYCFILISWYVMDVVDEVKKIFKDLKKP